MMMRVLTMLVRLGWTTCWEQWWWECWQCWWKVEQPAENNDNESVGNAGKIRLNYLLRTMMMRVLAMLVRLGWTTWWEQWWWECWQSWWDYDELPAENNDDESVGNAGEIRMNYLLRTMMMRVLAILVRLGWITCWEQRWWECWQCWWKDELPAENNDDESVGNAGKIRMNYLLRTMMMSVLSMLVR